MSRKETLDRVQAEIFELFEKAERSSLTPSEKIRLAKLEHEEQGLLRIGLQKFRVKHETYCSQCDALAPVACRVSGAPWCASCAEKPQPSKAGVAGVPYDEGDGVLYQNGLRAMEDSCRNEG